MARKSLLSLSRFSLSKFTGKMPQHLKVDVWNNRVSLAVFTNNEANPRKGVISTNLNLLEWYAFSKAGKEVLEKGQSGTKVQLQTYRITTKDFEGKNKRIKENGPVIYFGINKEGMAYVVLIAENQDKVVFEFENSDWPLMVTAAGGDVTKQQASIYYAYGWLEMLDKVLACILTEEFHHIDPNEGNGNWGGGNRNQGGNKGTTEADVNEMF